MEMKGDHIRNKRTRKHVFFFFKRLQVCSKYHIVGLLIRPAAPRVIFNEAQAWTCSLHVNGRDCRCEKERWAREGGVVAVVRVLFHVMLTIG